MNTSVEDAKFMMVVGTGICESIVISFSLRGSHCIRIWDDSKNKLDTKIMLK